MASEDGSGGNSPGQAAPAPPEWNPAPAAGSGCGDVEEDPQFQCCVCLDLLYKPVVIACGHMSCFWCVHKAMHVIRESHCAVCRQPYKHFPSICQLLHHLLIKLEPVEYKRREKEVLEDEKRVDTYSPQIIEFLNFRSNNCEIDGENRPEESNSQSSAEHLKKVKLEDVSCALCKELLYQPAVLNCGHVYCMSCLSSLDDGALECKVCGGLHPGDVPNVCLDLDHFIEEYFPVEYDLKREKIQLLKGECNIKGSSSGTSSTKEGGGRASKKENFALKDDDLSDVHIGVGCDSCGVYPIRGKRYRCKDCTELIGFDLCEECYNTKSKLPGRFNQHHTPDHRMELDNSALLHRIMRLQGIHEEGPGGVIIGEFVAPGAVVHVIPDDLEELEDMGEEDQLL
ncbi:E3 ubiquitin-protein ligase PRT1-like [Oryza brachyantha]|uniref:E3 ubiquitin-protein ligase PRT1 n=1 Tax=Oryza brachyantha TaxID=4533 RepID=J3LEW8_ORYBR|nr:E3 ubiquitin-protein ligase PRT1-like [Oryza brachyantha]